jgi:hypothetical protein
MLSLPAQSLKLDNMGVGKMHGNRIHCPQCNSLIKTASLFRGGCFRKRVNRGDKCWSHTRNVGSIAGINPDDVIYLNESWHVNF